MDFGKGDWGRGLEMWVGDLQWQGIGCRRYWYEVFMGVNIGQGQLWIEQSRVIEFGQGQRKSSWVLGGGGVGRIE